MNRSTQQPLELSPAMLVALGLVAMIGLFGLTGSGRQQGTIERVTDQTIEFNRLGIRVHPAEGWTYLSVSSRDPRAGTVFVNASKHLIVRMHAFPFESWPPAANELLDRGVNPQEDDADATAASLDQLPVVRKDYANVSIEWIEVEGRRSQGDRFLVGRLAHANVDVMATAMIHSDTVDADQSLGQLWDSIEFIRSSNQP